MASWKLAATNRVIRNGLVLNQGRAPFRVTRRRPWRVTFRRNCCDTSSLAPRAESHARDFLKHGVQGSERQRTVSALRRRCFGALKPQHTNDLTERRSFGAE